jgi:phospholipid N-methyltransferase
MRSGFLERLLFLRAFVTHPRRVGAVLPTSRRAVRDMLDMADLGSADLVVELGAGTGVYTREILARVSKNARFVAFERDPRLAQLLTGRWNDARLEVRCDSAENLLAYLQGRKADVIVSGLPFTSLESEVRRRIFAQLVQALAPDGVALVLQYSTFVQPELRRLFPSVKRRVSLLNVPPAVLFACSLSEPPLASAEGGRRP